MFYQQELSFLREVLQKKHVNSFALLKNEWDKPTQTPNEDVFGERAFFSKILPTLQDKRLYKFTDRFKRSYCFLLLPNTETPTALCIGPFLRNSLSKQYLFELGENNGISPQKHHYLLEYYHALPILTETSELFVMLNTFCERIWQTPSFPIVDFLEENAHADPPFSKSMLNLEANDTLINKKPLRYGMRLKMS